MAGIAQSRADVSFPFTRILAGLKIASVLTGPVERQRLRGRPYKARLGANECLFGVSEAVVEVSHSQTNDLAYYGDPTHSELRERLAQAWGQPKTAIVVGQGIEGLLELFVRAFVEPGDAVVTSRGTYPTIKYYVSGFGGRVVEVSYTARGRIDLDALAAAASESKAKLLYLVNPDNPTGVMIPADELRSFLQRLADGCIVLLDEAYAEYAPPALVMPPDESRVNLIRLRSFSKIYGLAGARIGYAVADPGIVGTVEQLRQRFGVSKLSNAMAMAALDSEEFIADVLARTAAGRRDYEAIAQAVGAKPVPSSANFVAFEFESALRAQAVTAWLEEKDIFVVRPTEPPLDRLVRITVGPDQDRCYLAETLRDIAAIERIHQSLAAR